MLKCPLCHKKSQILQPRLNALIIDRFFHFSTFVLLQPSHTLPLPPLPPFGPVISYLLGCLVAWFLLWLLLSHPSLHQTICSVLTFDPQAINSKTIKCQAKRNNKTLKQKQRYKSCFIDSILFQICLVVVFFN